MKNEKEKLLDKMYELHKGAGDIEPTLSHLPIEYLKKIYEARKIFISSGDVGLMEWARREKAFKENEMSLSLTGYILGITRERVRQIQSKALKRKYLNS